MSDDPRFEELIRRRAGKNGSRNGSTKQHEAIPAADQEIRTLDEPGRLKLRTLAVRHAGWSASDLADAFEGEFGWRPTGKEVGDAISRVRKGHLTGVAAITPEPAPALPEAAPAASRPDAFDPEIQALAGVSLALAGLSPAAVRRVLDWAGSRYVVKEKEGVRP